MNGESTLFSCSSLGAGSSIISFSFNVPPELLTGTTYYMAIRYTSNTNADEGNCVRVSVDDLGNYGMGVDAYDGASWSNISGKDFYFNIFDDKLRLSNSFTIIAMAKKYFRGINCGT